MLGCWQAADTALRMFAEMLSQTDGLVGIYAAEADRRRVAGLACEAAYADAQGGVATMPLRSGHSSGVQTRKFTLFR
ncbi:DUF2514 family protein [Alcaligenes faecalis]|nr:DUF2514 family protein [Alcaligenes faecalis]